MKKNYQTRTAAVATAVEAVMPDAVTVTLAELAGSMREGLLALAVGAGFQVMDAIIAESVTALAGPKGRHDPNRTAVRHGCEDGSVVLGGRTVRNVGAVIDRISSSVQPAKSWTTGCIRWRNGKKSAGFGATAS